MYSIIKRLRQHGQRRSDRHISSDPGLTCSISLYGLGGEIVAVAHDRTDPMCSPLIPALYGARVVTIKGGRMLIEGLEREGQDRRATTYLQEWSVSVLPQP